ncbi:5-amino-6-uracil reductase-like protein [Lojkania enalia]|uniref:2,5-diamino-6-ribosylamino-4(3H)-pyrimidinone 5'-phosphate reductase n=1 Tax=Lojkania enalia TaxID=147567 RepID=A0A9P4JUV4_9PLEO|nr:5-amino-6-uracil reductase-like protein [Didymosphaeria enalia]
MLEPPRDVLTFSSSSSQQVDPYLPASSSYLSSSTKPPIYITLTFATSLDSNLALAPGTQTALSGPQSKSMTHYLRSKHDAILIGVGTAIADDPSLNCRIAGVGGYGGEGLLGQPRPVVLDPKGRWDFSEDNKVFRLAKAGRGKAPLVISTEDIGERKRKALENVGGRNIVLSSDTVSSISAIPWSSILTMLQNEGIKSVMIEGGGAVINNLLHPRNISLVNTVIVTIVPTWLGKGGVLVCPDERVEGDTKLPVGRLEDVKWVPLGEDVVLCGRPMS